MDIPRETPKTLTADPLTFCQTPGLANWLNAFYNARRAEGRAPGTLAFYQKKLTAFLEFCGKRNVSEVEHIDADLLRQFILHLQARAIQPETVHGYFRAVRAFMRWYEVEDAPEGWRNPVKRISPPKVPEKILKPVELADITAMLAKCEGAHGLRDKAVLLTLLDTGARAAELCGFDLADFDAASGALVIQRGKGGRGRMAFLGHKARRAVRAYVKQRGARPGALFLSRYSGRMTYECLRGILERRAAAAGLAQAPSAHDFRRACAIGLLRNGADLASVSRLLGHSSLQVTMRYLNQTREDLQTAHAANSPVDRADL